MATVTSALTSQVLPNSNANWTMFFVSSSRNAAPMKARSMYRAHLAERATAEEPDGDERGGQDQRQHPQVARGNGVVQQVGERMIVRGRGDLGAAPHRPVPGPGAVRHGLPGRLVGQHGQPPSAQRRSYLRTGRLPERVQHRGRVAVVQVVRVVVVHGHGAAGGEVRPGGLDRLEREQVALQPQVGLAVHRGQRVGQGEQDQVVLLAWCSAGRPGRQRCAWSPGGCRTGGSGAGFCPA